MTSAPTGEMRQGLTEAQWREARREAARHFRQVRLRPLRNAAVVVGYFAFGAAVIVALALLAALIGWLFGL